MSDILRFEKISTKEIIEDWAEDYDDEIILLKIYVNDRVLEDIALDYEQDMINENNKDYFKYGHTRIIWNYDSLHLESNRKCVMPLCCFDCGEPGCCGFSFEWNIINDEKIIEWHSFHILNIGKIDLKFRFDLDQYINELNKLKAWCLEYDENEMRRLGSVKKVVSLEINGSFLVRITI